MTSRIGLILEPLDVLFFRDGRPFEAGIRVGGQAIMPQTLAGACERLCSTAPVAISERSGRRCKAAHLSRRLSPRNRPS